MRHLKVNLLSDGPDDSATIPPTEGTGRSPVSFFLSPVLIALAFVMSFGFGRLTLSETTSLALDNIPIIAQMRHLISSPNRQLAGEADDRVNILLLGMGGEGHEGPNLTDTIMVASIKPSEKKVALLSVPRDLIVPTESHGWRKINSVNAFGEMTSPGRGSDYARTALEGLLGIDIPYYVRVDFSGFTQLIDGVGGIDVHVDKKFADYSYPTNDYGVTAISFTEGWQHMSGATALKFTRSRHGTNGEGSDFARAARQQKVLTALKDKMLEAKTYRNPVAIVNTLAALQSNITSNLQIGEMLRLGRMAENDGGFTITRKVLDNSPTSPLVDSTFAGAYVLVPKNGDWTALRTIATNIFTESIADAVPPQPKPTDGAEKARVEIMNGTGRSGQARVAATSLSGAGLEIVKIGNADSFTYPRSVVYDLTAGKKPLALALIKQTIGDIESRGTVPRSLADTDRTGVDFLVILGQKDAAGSGT